MWTLNNEVERKNKMENVILEKTLQVVNVSIPYIQKKYVEDFRSFVFKKERSSSLDSFTLVSIDCWPGGEIFGEKATQVVFRIVEDTPEEADLFPKYWDEGFKDNLGRFLCVGKELEDTAHYSLHKESLTPEDPYTEIYIDNSDPLNFEVGKIYRVLFKKVL